MTHVVDFEAHGSETLSDFVSSQLRQGVPEEFLPRIERTFRENKYPPYPGYRTFRKREERPDETFRLAVERTLEVVNEFMDSDDQVMREIKQEQENDSKNWWERGTDDVEADNHYYDLVRLFDEIYHQKYWEKQDWFFLWDHATSAIGYLPTEW